MKRVKKSKSILPLEWHIERAMDKLKGMYNITPMTVGSAYPRYLDREIMERLK